MAFDFLGIMNQTQLDELVSWLDDRETTHREISEFWRMRSRQVRKTSGILERFYSSKGISSTFKKEVHQVGKDFFLPNFGDDVEPANRMTDIKTPIKAQLRVGDEANFWINHIAATIERCDDLAQEAIEAPEKIKSAISSLRTLFDDPRFRNQVLIKKNKEAEYRVDPLAQPGSSEINYARNPATAEYGK